MKKEKQPQDFLAQFMGNPARARVLRALVLNETEAFTEVRLGKLAGVSPLATRKECAALARIGLVRKGSAVVGKKGTKKPETMWFIDPH